MNLLKCARSAVFGLLVAGLVPAMGVAAAKPSPSARTGDAVMTLNRYSVWTPVSAVGIDFDSHHAQGMVKIGEDFFVTSVEVIERTQPYPQPRGRFDRDAGKGQGWLFKMNAKGELLAKLKLGEGAMYHAGGLDFDGRYLWVPVAEYRPNGPSIIYRVDPVTLEAVEAFRFPDHIGALTRNTDANTLVGVNWGGRRFYTWRLDRRGQVVQARAEPVVSRAHYIGYQDCHYAGGRRMLCGGVANYRPSPNYPSAALGGLDLLDLADFRPLWQAPVQAWTAKGAVMTSNAAWFEATERGVRGYFLPENNRGSLYVYEAVTPPP